MPALERNRIACFISPHGYGHAARAAAVMEAFHYHDPEKEFEIFASVPEWFFRHSEYFHPDLVTASDALIGNVGYSTFQKSIGPESLSGMLLGVTSENPGF